MFPLAQINQIESAVAATIYYLKSEVHWYQILDYVKSEKNILISIQPSSILSSFIKALHTTLKLGTDAWDRTVLVADSL